MTDAAAGKRYRVAITVFAEVEDCADELDAAYIAEVAIRQQFNADGKPRVPAKISARTRRAEIPVEVVKVIETGMAIGNGYLRTEPSSKAFREMRRD